jgi:hypothetical protein
MPIYVIEKPLAQDRWKGVEIEKAGLMKNLMNPSDKNKGEV